VFVFFGVLAVSGSFYLQTGFLSSEAVFAGMAMGSFAAAVLHTNNVRDMQEDRKAGRHTLAIVIDDLMRQEGQSAQEAQRAVFETMGAVYGGFIFAPYSFLVMHPLLFSGHPVPVLHWLPLLSLPGAALAVHVFTQMRTGGQANRLLVMTVGLQLLFATLFAVAYLLG
jgi:1,4-dihydroxy-2-naphthoate octaprenyltransferase